MTDVARLAEVSQSCVSLVLNDAPGARVPEATRQRVIRAAERLGYQLPGPRARSRPRTADADAPTATATERDTIAFIVDEISVSPHAVLQLDGARDAAWTYEHLVETYVTRSHKSLEEATIAAVRADRRVAGVIYASSFMREVEVPAGLRGLPVVLMNCYEPGSGLPTLLADDVSGGFAATQYLLIYDHKRIAMINGERWMDVSKSRLRGYRDALAAAGIDYDPALVRFGDWSVASGYRRTLALMRQPDPPTAFYCANDMMALGCLEALAELGLSVPRQVSVVGHNDISVAAHTRPALSSCRPPSYEMGKQAVDMLIEMAQGHRSYQGTEIKLECKLIVRSSVSFRDKGGEKAGAGKRGEKATAGNGVASNGTAGSSGIDAVAAGAAAESAAAEHTEPIRLANGRASSRRRAPAR